jgi:4'-phosphopantetheinyl transferase
MRVVTDAWAEETLGAWASSPPPTLVDGAVHVWCVRVDTPVSEEDWSLLSPEEQAHARRFHFERDRQRYVASHGTLRRLLGDYAGIPGAQLEFDTGDFGKPALRGAGALEFNLAHSGDIALIAISRDRALGIDVERWQSDIEHMTLAEHFFSGAERDALRVLDEIEERVACFFAAWSRKEAYLKASGHGVTRGLDHFDVSLAPGQTARLIADRLDTAATERWVMCALAPAAGYSAALVAAAPVSEILLFDAPTPAHLQR